MNSSPIVKCSHCKQILSSEDFDAHRCDLPLTDVKRIPVVYFQDDSYGDKKLMTGWGIDGVLYTFEVVPRKPIPLILSPSDEFLQKHESDDKFTESTRRTFLFSVMLLFLCRMMRRH